MRLTRGEAWWLVRRRRNWTMPHMACSLHVSEGRLRAWEKDRAIAPDPRNFQYARSGMLTTPLTDGEYATLCRRRMALYQHDVVRYTELSRVSINRAERDLTTTARTLARWWHKNHGTPRAKAAAPIIVTYAAR